MKEHDPRAIELVGLWWIVWIAATVVSPPLVLILARRHDQVALGFLAVAVILHFVASVMILRVNRMARPNDPNFRPNPNLGVWLILGGWALLAGIFFVGCLAAIA